MITYMHRYKNNKNLSKLVANFLNLIKGSITGKKEWMAKHLKGSMTGKREFLNEVIKYPHLDEA